MAARARQLRSDPSGFGRRLSFDPSKLTNEKRCIELLNVRSPFRLDLSRPLFDSFVVIGAPLHTSVLADNQKVSAAVLYKYPEDLALPEGLANFAMPSGVTIKAISRRESVSSINNMLAGIGAHSANGSGDESFVFQLANDFGPLYVACVCTQEPIRDRASFMPPAPLVPDPDHRPLPPPPSLAGCTLTGGRVYMFVSRFPYFSLHFAVLHNILQQERWYKINNIIQQDKQSPLAQILDPEASGAEGGTADDSSLGESAGDSDDGTDGAGSSSRATHEEDKGKHKLQHSESSALGRLKAKWAARKERKAREKAAQEGMYANVDEAADAVSSPSPKAQQSPQHPGNETKKKTAASTQEARNQRADGGSTQPSAGYSEDITDARVSQLLAPSGFELRGETPASSPGFLPTSDQGEGNSVYETPPEIRNLRQDIDAALRKSPRQDDDNATTAATTAAAGAAPAPSESGSMYHTPEGGEGVMSTDSLMVSSDTTTPNRARFASAVGESGLLWTHDGLPDDYNSFGTPDASTDTHMTATETDVTETEITEFTADDVSDTEADLDTPLTTLRLSDDDSISMPAQDLDNLDQSFISLPKHDIKVAQAAAAAAEALSDNGKQDQGDGEESKNTKVDSNSDDTSTDDIKKKTKSYTTPTIITDPSPARPRVMSRRISRSKRGMAVEFDLPPEQRDELTILKRQSRDMFKRRPSHAISPQEPSTVFTTLSHYRTLKPPGPGESVQFNPMPGDGQKPQFIEYSVPKGRDEQTLLAGWGVAAAAKVLSREHLVHLMTAVLIEKRVVIVCPHLGVLSSVGTAVMSLLRPLTWEGIFVPILPQTMTEFLDAPVPFICGVQYLTDLPDHVMQDEDFVIVDVVNDRVALPKKSMSSLPHRKALDSALKPVHKHFSAGIKATIKKWNQRSKRKVYKTPYSVVSQQPQHMLDAEQQANVEALLNVFHSFIVETMIPLDSIHPHVITDMNDPTHPVKMFMRDSFLAACDKKTKAFYSQFCETQLFSSYFEEQIGNPVKRRERSGRRR